jgi:TonB family protein
MPLLEENTQQSEIEIDPSVLEEGANQRQRRQMLFALALLLVALILVLLKDREFWFPPSPASETEQAEENAPDSDATSPSEKQTIGTLPPASSRPKAKQHAPASGSALPAAQAIPPPTIPTRAVLPPLEVEVVAGDEHRTIPTASGSVRVDLQGRAPFSGSQLSARSSGPVASNVGGSMPSTAGRVRITPSAAEIVSRPVEPNYPLLAKQMKVQGAVVLDALIGRDGNIQALNVVSGPDILSDAARQAVKQWRFRPHLQSGEPVETAARITVNFTISTQ